MGVPVWMQNAADSFSGRDLSGRKASAAEALAEAERQRLAKEAADKEAARLEAMRRAGGNADRVTADNPAGLDFNKAKGGVIKAYAKGGIVRARDGIAAKGKTKGRYI